MGGWRELSSDWCGVLQVYVENVRSGGGLDLVLVNAASELLYGYTEFCKSSVTKIGVRVWFFSAVYIRWVYLLNSGLASWGCLYLPPLGLYSAYLTVYNIENVGPELLMWCPDFDSICSRAQPLSSPDLRDLKLGTDRKSGAFPRPGATAT